MACFYHLHHIALDRNQVGICAVLCCAVLCCAVLCCAVLCCAVLCCAVLCCAVLCCAVLCYPILSYPILSYPILSYPLLIYSTVWHGMTGRRSHDPSPLTALAVSARCCVTRFSHGRDRRYLLIAVPCCATCTPKVSVWDGEVLCLCECDCMYVYVCACVCQCPYNGLTLLILCSLLIRLLHSCHFSYLVILHYGFATAVCAV